MRAARLLRGGGVAADGEVLEKVLGETRAAPETQKAEDAVGQTFRCPVCLDITPVGDCVVFGCGNDHSVCSTCLREYLKQRIAAGQTREEQLVCPMPQCNWALPEQQIQASLSRTVSGTRAYEKLQDLRVHNLEPGPGETSLQCPQPDCARFLVPEVVVERASEVECPYCGHCFCPRCSGKPHGRKPCGSSNVDGSLDDLAEKEGWKRCPQCNALCERAEGCQFMTCNCGKKFCYLCGVQLSEEDHIPHYTGFEGAQGPFGATCVNRREALAAHRDPPGQPPAPKLTCESTKGPMGEQSAELKIEWPPFKADPPVLEYAVDICRDGFWSCAGETYETQLDLRHIEPLPGCEYAAALRASNVNGWGPRGPSSPPLCVDRRGVRALLVRELSGEVWPGIAMRRRPRNLRPLA